MIIDASNFNANILSAVKIQPRKKGNQGTKAKVQYKDIVCAFDIETTYIKEIGRAVLYIWQFQIDEICTVIGRTWKEFIDFHKRLKDAVSDALIVTYIHNASYEFQFLRSLFDLPSDAVMVIKARRVLKFTVAPFEFRCSYLQSNMALAAFTKKFDVKHQKLSGDDFDYRKYRFPDTELTDKELEYCVNDVRGLVEAIKAEMARDNDNLYTIPLTSTGYVRRDVKAALRLWGRYKVNELLPNAEIYTLFREAFRGGNVHANRYFVKNPDFPMPPLENVGSADRSSSYPDTEVNYEFPMSTFKRVVKTVSYTELKKHYIEKRHYALIFRLQIKNVKMRDRLDPCPYIPLDKCRNVKNRILDNGRILSADSLEITVTDIDFKIIDKQYVLSDENTIISDVYFAHYDYLPSELRELIKTYYKQKTELKGVDGKQLYYDKFKNLINACYGCSAQDPAKESIIYQQNSDDIYVIEDKTIAELLQQSYATMPYQWGVWTTARARERLQIMIDAVHENKTSEFVYCDTDSVKYIGTYDIEKINAELREIAIKNGAYADDIKGVRHYMGVYEDEGRYKQFETLGAKSYVYRDDNEQLHITIAGVPKSKGAAELEKMGGFDAYKIGTIFHDGITETVYHDERCYSVAEYDGHKIEITSDIVIKDSFHQIGWSKDYTILLSNLDGADIDKLLRKR